MYLTLISCVHFLVLSPNVLLYFNFPLLFAFTFVLFISHHACSGTETFLRRGQSKLIVNILACPCTLSPLLFFLPSPYCKTYKYSGL